MKKFVAIEALRGWMAWWVVLGHAVELTGLGPMMPGFTWKFFASSYLAVQVFMIVSGFVIAHLLTIKREPYLNYITHRWFRLMPLLLAMLAVCWLTRGLYQVAWIDNGWAGDSTARIARMQVEDRLWPLHLLLHLTLLHGVIPESILPFAASTFLAPAWSLSLEWQFYLVAPLLVLGVGGLRRTWLSWLLIALSVPTLLGWFGTWTSANASLLQNLAFFFIGIASRQAFDGKLPRATMAAAAISVVILVLTRGVSQLPALLFVGVIWGFFWTVTAREAGLLTLENRWLDRAAALLAYNRVIAELGRISYSTYLAHVPVMTLIVGGGLWITGRHDQPTVVALTGLAMLLTVPVSFLLYHTVENPGVRLGRRLFPARKA